MGYRVPPNTFGVPPVSETDFSIFAAIEDGVGPQAGEGPDDLVKLEVQSVGVVASIHKSHEGLVGSSDVVFVEG